MDPDELQYSIIKAWYQKYQRFPTPEELIAQLKPYYEQITQNSTACSPSTSSANANRNTPVINNSTSTSKKNEDLRKCGQCGSLFNDVIMFYKHRKQCKPDPHKSVPYAENEFIRRYQIGESLVETCRDIRFEPHPSSVNMIPDEFLENLRPLLEDMIRFIKEEALEVKFNSVLSVVLIKIDDHGEVKIRDTFYFCTAAQDVNDLYIPSLFNSHKEQVTQFVHQGSGWIIEKVNYLDIHLTRFKSIRHRAGRSNRTFQQLPPKLKNKNAVINVCNPGEDCFRYALLSVLHYNEITPRHRYRVSKYSEWLNEHDWSGITWPMTKAQLPRFE
ncbi:MAG: hypothetical protein EX263_13900, partial [Flavobacteriaceae bacterium]